MSRKKTIIISIIILILIIAIDQITKIFMINKQIVLIPNFLNLDYLENKTNMFGVRNTNIWIVSIEIFVVCAIILKLIHERKDEINAKTLIGLDFILAGGISNLIDIIFRGFVIDFIHVNILKFPIFNIADICVTLGVFFLIILSIKNIRKSSN